jgi:KipI family sensor histidine kinase inhibitor
VNDYSLEFVNEDSLLISWDLKEALPQPADAFKIAALAKQILAEHGSSIVNVVPAYRTLLVQYDVLEITAEETSYLLHRLLTNLSSQTQTEQDKVGTLHKIPVYYHPEVAEDLLSLCETKALSVEELIQKHTEQTYTVYAIGFKPGFAYLGYVPGVLEVARKKSFRGELAAGSVGIADRQTAIYPSKSPGGWNIIGRSPMPMLDQSHAVLQVGDEVCFYSIGEKQYLLLGGAFDSDSVEP